MKTIETLFHYLHVLKIYPNKGWHQNNIDTFITVLTVDFPKGKKKQHFIYTYIISLLSEGFPLTEWGHKNNYTSTHTY